MQMVVRVIDKYEGDDPYLRAKTTGRGDVIEVVDDDHEFGRLDLINPDWVILRAPISRAKALAMKSGDQDELNPLSRLRAFALDLDILITHGYPIPSLAQARRIRDDYERDATEQGTAKSEVKHSPKYARPIAIFEILESDFDAAKFAKPAIEDRTIIG